MSKLHEECGVFGIYLNNGEKGVVQPVYHALYALQHRGQESCGIAVNTRGVISCYKDVGLVGEVFSRDVLAKLPEGSIAVGHCRYGTTGVQSQANAQPLLVNHLKGGMALAHNGNIVNAQALREEQELGGAIFHTTSDSEVIAYTITHERLRTASIEEAVLSAMKRLKGAYTLVLVSPTKLIAARDPNGFRPLCMGELGGRHRVRQRNLRAGRHRREIRARREARRGRGGGQDGVRSLAAGRQAPLPVALRVRVHLFRPARQRDRRRVRAPGAAPGGRVSGAGAPRAGGRGGRRSRSAASTPPSATPASPASPTGSGSSKTSTSAARSSSRGSWSAPTPCRSS